MPFTLTFTRAGQEKFIAAQLGDDIDLTVTEVGLTDTAFVVAPTLEAVPGEHRRVGTISGDAVGNNIVHLIVRDDSAAGYGVRGFGLYLSDGTLFAVYGQADRIVEKSTLTSLYFAVDIAFPAGDAVSVSFGDTSFLDPPATTERRGVIEIATGAEAQAGLDAVRAIVPATLKLVLDAFRAAVNADIAALQAAFAAYQAQLNANFAAFQAATNAAIATITARTITGAGLAVGGGSLAANRTITVPAASAAELRAAADATKAVTPASFGGLPRSLGNPAYEVLPGGKCIQSGQVRSGFSDQGSISITFPIAFADADYDLQLTAIIPSAGDFDNYPQEIAGTRTATGVTIYLQDASTGGSGQLTGFNWRAEGRA
ncbi:MAG: hypothetical protein A4S12_07025 [Proteobacteria bacterium SG_bin5]|nr:hypothetical protein [Sphingomonas sp.]OQW42085.1 MAG: hypothetical protein A4S12_07025 [Proteobacteria bacterium SG_bin5]